MDFNELSVTIGTVQYTPVNPMNNSKYEKVHFQSQFILTMPGLFISFTHVSYLRFQTHGKHMQGQQCILVS